MTSSTENLAKRKKMRGTQIKTDPTTVQTRRRTKVKHLMIAKKIRTSQNKRKTGMVSSSREKALLTRDSP